MCAIANINAGKNLVYPVILVVRGGFVLFISSNMALMEDQVRAS